MLGRSVVNELAGSAASRSVLDFTPSNEAGTEKREPEPHSFIVKIWLEETAAEAGIVRWAGSVTHVPGGERQNVSDVTQIASAIMTYLQSMGVKPGMKWRIWWRLFRP